MMPYAESYGRRAKGRKAQRQQRKGQDFRGGRRLEFAAMVPTLSTPVRSALHGPVSVEIDAACPEAALPGRSAPSKYPRSTS